MDMITFGLLNQELGRGCSSLRSLLTVHSMAAHAVLRWGNKEQNADLVAKLATGARIGAFALTEPAAGSDAAGIETTAKPMGDSFVLNGVKRWITFGQVADLFLVFAKSDGAGCAFLIDRDTPGLEVDPISGMLGMRASMLADLHFRNCRVPKEALVGKVGFGLSHVASTALDCGRYSVAWGCVGIAQACLEASLNYTSERKQFGVLLKEHQLIQQMIAEMTVSLKAARLLCYNAGCLKHQGEPSSIAETFVAKYFASRAAAKTASDAVQIHGANGCSDQYPVERYMRDAKIMEIIEGSNQIQQITIAGFAYQQHCA